MASDSQVSKPNNNKHILFNILGIKISIRKNLNTKKFPQKPDTCLNETINISGVIHSFDTQKKDNKVVIFAMYSKNGLINDNIILYLKELKKYNDYIILIGDNPIQEKELIKINSLVDYYSFSRHGEYDFGSYKRGYEYLEKNNYLHSISNIVFCNDSVTYVGASLENFFENAFKEPFYGLTYHEYGYIKKCFSNKFIWGKVPHIQSYLYTVSKEIFLNKTFKKFMHSIKKEKNKKLIIYKYEEGLSKIILKLHHKLVSYYPQIHEDIEPFKYYLNKESNFNGERLFYKNKKYKPIKINLAKE